jgi:hypothetical protein
MEKQPLNHPRTQEVTFPLSFDQNGRVFLNEEKVPLERQQPAGISDRVADVFLGMGYMKENCSPNAC